MKSHEKVWLARRIDIARYWAEPIRSSRMKIGRRACRKMTSLVASEACSSTRTGSPDAPSQANLAPANDTASGLHAALCAVFREATKRKRLTVLTAHPDLAGKLAQAKA